MWTPRGKWILVQIIEMSNYQGQYTVCMAKNLLYMHNGRA